MQLRILRNAALSGCLGAATAFSWFQTGKELARPSYLELTQADPFSVKNWTSAQIQIAGLHLGMTRDQANAVVSKEGFRLEQDSPTHVKRVPCSDDRYCFLEQVIVQFAKTGEIVEIEIVPGEYKGILIRKFKGQTSLLFENKYTDSLRLKLLGPESSREVINARDTKYIYSKRGFTMTVARSGLTQPGYELDNVSFIPPTSSP